MWNVGRIQYGAFGVSVVTMMLFSVGVASGYTYNQLKAFRSAGRAIARGNRPTKPQVLPHPPAPRPKPQAPRRAKPDANLTNYLSETLGITNTQQLHLIADRLKQDLKHTEPQKHEVSEADGRFHKEHKELTDLIEQYEDVFAHLRESLGVDNVQDMVQAMRLKSKELFEAREMLADLADYAQGHSNL